MKIAIHNSFIGQKYPAETELVRRICLAAENLGWEAIEVGSHCEIELFQPDFVLVTHFNTAKLSQFPTYGCMWNPPIFIDRYEDFIDSYDRNSKGKKKYRNILSYDSYLSSSNIISEWIRSEFNNTTKQFFIAPFYPSCNQTEYIAPDINEPKLVYIGSNWDGSRFKRLFQGLDSKINIQVYGSKWNYLKNIYRGNIPFDGVSVLNTLRQAGIGLCLHKQEHQDSETPSMRIFEIVASGAIAICGEHRFIREHFGNNVLYIDTCASIASQLEQISNHIDWIKNNQKEALKMSWRSHSIFLEQFTLEKLLLGIIPNHQKLIRDKGFIKSYKVPQSQTKQIEYIVRVGDRGLKMIKRCLDSIVNQSYSNIAVILVKYKEIEGLSEFLVEYNHKIKIKLVESEYTGFRSTQLKDGINAIAADYFGILDDDDTIHPNHAFSLISMLEKYEFAGVAYSGTIRCWEEQENLRTINKEIAYFEDFNIHKIAKFKNFIPLNSFVARSNLISNVYREDPKLNYAEDFFLILRLCQKSIFVFSYELTCEYNLRINREENASFEYESKTKDIRKNRHLVLTDPVSKALYQIFWDEYFVVLVNDPNNRFLLNQKQTKKIKISELKYTKPEKLLGAGKQPDSFSPYSFLRIIYLKLSNGGKFNQNPNFLNRVLIYLKKLIFE